jgi:hypothetical protein
MRGVEVIMKIYFPKRLNTQKGLAIVLTLFSLLLIATVAFGIIAVTQVQNRSTMNMFSSEKAYYAARTGLCLAIDQVEDLYRSSNYVGGTSNPVSGVSGDGQYTFEVWAPPSNATKSYKAWRITSEGVVDGARRVLTAWVEMESFAEFTVFNSVDGDDAKDIHWSNTDVVTGPVHTNSFFHVRGNPKFSSRVTSANVGDSRYNRTTNTYTFNGITYKDPTKFYKPEVSYNQDYPTGLSSDFSFSGGVPEIPMPYDNTIIKNNADKKYTGDISVKFYINDQMEVTYNDSGTTKTETLNTTEITVYTTGKITVLGGTLKGKITLASEGDIDILSDIRYGNKNKDVLGLISYNNIVIKTDPNVVKDLYLDSALLAPNGSMSVQNYNTGVKRGKLILFGGIAQKERGFVSYIPTNSGYDKQYTYDPKMAFFTSPNYPCTGNLKIIMIQDSSAIN